MTEMNSDEIKRLISLDTFNDTSLFTVSVIDLATYEVLYANQAMKNIMADMTATNCWEIIHGQDAPCLWCKAPLLLKNYYDNKMAPKFIANNEYAVYEKFNEVANKWYQIQEKVITLKDSRKVLVSFALDISTQKEAQSKLIETHVKLANQTKALQEAQKKLKELANKDSLTDLYNRRYFNDIAITLTAIGKRKKTPLSLLMMDIDKFKAINDNYGHAVGDNVIRLLADKLLEYTRESDIVARLGGEEFAIILTNTDKKNAFAIAENLRKKIEQLSFNEITFTVSIGVNEFDYDQDTSIHDSLNRADKALYSAKKSGRNRVC